MANDGQEGEGRASFIDCPIGAQTSWASEQQPHLIFGRSAEESAVTPAAPPPTTEGVPDAAEGARQPQNPALRRVRSRHLRDPLVEFTMDECFFCHKDFTYGDNL